jgi:hypothetical protein
VVAAFDGGRVSSDAGALLLKRTDEAIELIDRLAECFIDHRDPGSVEHSVRTLIGQRVFGMALGYEDLNDHDQLRHDPVWATLLGKLQARRSDCAALAGKSTLNRLELFPSSDISRYHKILPQVEPIERLFVDVFLEAHTKPPQRIVLDLDATDDPLHGQQEGRFFHGYYNHYCYLPLYIFCGEHLLCATLRPANIDASAGALEEIERIVALIEERWPHTDIILRADSGFAREELMRWCEESGIHYVFGLARNERLEWRVAPELYEAALESVRTRRPARRFKDFTYMTWRSWSCFRRVIGKAEYTGDKYNPRFLVTSISKKDIAARELYEQLYCARGEMENRIKEAQLDLFADRLSTATFRGNQLRLWFASAAYVLMHALRRVGLTGTSLARACANTIRLKLLKIGALVTVSVRRVKLAMSEGCPYQREFIAAFHNLSAAAR